MSDNDWLPDSPEFHSIEVGSITPGKGFRPSRPAISDNPFEGSNDPRLVNIGKWLVSCPPEMNSGIAAHTGLIAGLAIALTGDVDNDLYDAICGRGFMPDENVDGMKEMFLMLAKDWFGF